MNKISERLITESKRCANEANTHFGTELEHAYGIAAVIATEDAAAIERLVQAARDAHNYIKHFRGCKVDPCDCGYFECADALKEALKPFEEEE